MSEQFPGQEEVRNTYDYRRIKDDIINAPDHMVRMFAVLTIIRESNGNLPNPFAGSFEPEDVDLLAFATAVNLAEQINRRNDNHFYPDHWISLREAFSWRGDDKADTTSRLRMSNLSVPYTEFQSDKSISTALKLLPLLQTDFKSPHK